MLSLVLSRTAFLLIVIVGLTGTVRADALNLPPVGAPGFKQLCEEMYEKRDTPEGWPADIQGPKHYCTLSMLGGDDTVMDADDYAWTLRKSLTFACKGRREVIYELIRRLNDCGGDTRTLELAPGLAPGACRVSFRETSESFVAEPKLIADLIDWRANMPWYERVLVDIFAPGELPMVMDGLIACGKGVTPRP